MPRLLPLLCAIASASSALAGSDMFILTQVATIAMARMDPIVNPGALSGHVHNIAGASNFGLTILSPEDQLKASCSSAIVGDDKSNYWAPALYWQYPNGTYQPMVGGNRIYYFMKGNNTKPFPPGFRMISGTAMARNVSDYKSTGLRISCDRVDQKGQLPTKQCTVVSMGIFFPSCGKADGSISSEDNFSHMAWPLGFKGAVPYDDANGEYCPESHPIKYPTIFYEANYYPVGAQQWGDGSRYVLSNGDSWGPSYHADFLNGWEPSVLSGAIKQCGGKGRGPGDQPAQCGPLAPSVNKDATVQCRLQGKIPNEDIGFYRPIKQLPGCNPRWDKGTDKKPGCSVKPADPPMVYPNVYFRGLEFNTHIPMPFSAAPADTDFSNVEAVKYAFQPSLGKPRSSYLVPWGSDGTNKGDLKASTVTELLASVVGNEAPANPAPSKSASASASSSVNLSGVSGVKPSSSSTSQATSSATSSSKAPATTTKNSLDGYKEAPNAKAASVSSSSAKSSSSAGASTSAVAPKAVASTNSGTSGSSGAMPGGANVLVAGNYTKKCLPKNRKVRKSHLQRKVKRGMLRH